MPALISPNNYLLQKLHILPTSAMIQPPSTNETKFVEIIKSHLEGLSDVSLTELGKKLFPIMSTSNIYASLYNCFHTFYTIRINKGQKFEDANKIIIKHAQELKDQCILPKIRDLLEDKEFTLGLEEVIENQLNNRKNIISIDKTNGKLMASQAQNGKINGNNGNSNNNTPLKKPKPNSNSTNIVDISDDSPTEKRSDQPEKHINSSNRIQNNEKPHQPQTFQPNHSISSDPYEVPNLSIRQVCLCGKACSMMQPKKDHVFKCYHCNLYYHIQCMHRGKNQLTQTDPIKKLASCSYCHLKDLIPMRQTMKTLFAGVLKQGRKRHEIIFNLDMMDLKTKKWRVQVRCFRLKDNIQTFSLFPDSASFSINNRFQKEFLPLPKQSSLKYRKDEPFLLTQHLINHQNKLTIIERIPKKQSKDDRIEPENHLLGIYLVEEKSVATLVKQIKADNVFTYFQSKAMLDRCLKIGDTEDITCEVLKIPIMCTLTIERIKTPVRGVFCSHYQCFDLGNFLVLTSSSVNPRWLCPLCKQPAYCFKYDVIIGAIIEQFSKYEPTEIMFTKDGQFKVYTNEELCPSIISNISALPIDSKFKRQIENPATEQEITREAIELNTDVEEHKIQSETNQSPVSYGNGEKKGSQNGSKNFEMPQDANIISLDDD